MTNPLEDLPLERHRLSGFRNHRLSRIPFLLASDCLGLIRVCGLAVASRWLLGILRTLRECLSRQSWQPADRHLGDGPFVVRYQAGCARMYGPQVVTGIREIWVRDAYLQGFLSIPVSGMVVDLGANMGNFTLLALAQSTMVHALCVEPNARHRHQMRRQLELNGWTERVTEVPAFVGAATPKQILMRQEIDECHDAECLSVERFVERYVPGSIEFLKCDIEGGEFSVLVPGSPLLRRARQIAVEIHDFAGDGDALLQGFRGSGFETRIAHRGEADRVVLCRRA